MHFLAWHYLLSARYHRATRSVLCICFVSIMLSSCALFVITAVTQGFEYTACQQLQQLHGDILIESWGNSLNVDKIKEVIRREFPEIKTLHAYSMHYGMLHNALQEVYDVISIKAIDLTDAHDALLRLVQLPQSPPSLACLLSNNQVLIGSLLAAHHNLKVGDLFSLLYIPDDTVHTKPEVEEYQLTVAGILKFGIEEYDSNMIICSFDLMHQLFPHKGVESIQVQVHPGTHEQKLIAALQQRLSLNVFSWKDLYPSLLAALKLEQYASIGLMIIVMLLASINIIALLSVYIQHKRKDIALLYALGASSTTVRRIFMCIGIIVTSAACCTGFMVALGIFLFLQYHPIYLPDAYIVSSLPVYISLAQTAALFAFIIGTSICASFLATRTITTDHIAGVLKGIV